MGSRSTTQSDASAPPVILLGGLTNALSVARSLGRAGVRVYAIGEDDSFVRHSRYVNWIVPNPNKSDEAAWTSYLLGAMSDHLKGAILLACSDAGIRVIAGNRDALAARFKLDLCSPAAQIELLDKVGTYKHAGAAAVNTPRHWFAESLEQVKAIRDELVYPLLIRPRLSHLFEKVFNRKHVTAHDFEQVLRAFSVALEAGVDVMLVEVIPGGDDQLSSYFTYVDADGSFLFDYTKRVIRRYPAGMGGTCYHITDWVPEIIEPSKRLLRQSGLVGLANIEYKHDFRDGQHKLIECNARFVASNGLVADSGYDLARLVYNRIAGLPAVKLGPFRSGMRLWDPARDLLALREGRRSGAITYAGWLASVMHFGHTFAYFRWYDPMPAWAKALRPLTKRLSHSLSRDKAAPPATSAIENPAAQAATDPG